MEISILWDLDDDEEVSYLIEPSQFNEENYVNTGHVHFTEVKYGIRPVFQSLNQSMYCVFDSRAEFPVLFTLNSFLDLLQLMTINNYSYRGINVKDVDHLALIANYSGRTFFSLFIDKHEIIKLVQDQIKNSEYNPVVR